MATHSSVLAWRIPGTGEPGGLPSMGSHRVGHDGSNLAAAAAAVVKNPPANAGNVRDVGLTPESERSPEHMATHFSIRVWRISGMEEPGRLQSMGSQKVRHN